MEAIIRDWTDIISTYMYTYVLVGLLTAVGIYFTIRLRVAQLIRLPHMIRLLGETTETVGFREGISPFKAFCISAASRIGTGNIVGVAVAISLGGPGAVFWMWMLAFLGAASAFVESTLAQVYKVENPDGTFRGGPAYYITEVLGYKWLATLFAIIISITYGFMFNAIQANTLAAAAESALHANGWISGIVIAGVTGIIIFGGVRRVADVSSKIVPVMALLYFAVACYVIITNIAFVPDMFASIFSNAFGIREFASGGLGVTIIQGVKRGLFSNEAGMGSVPNAAATADTSHPAKQGFVQAIGVYVDTWIVCTATAFIILLSGENFYNSNLKGLAITQNALANVVGDWGLPFLSLCVFLFAFSSIIGNYYYGESNIEFIGGGKGALQVYRALVCGMVFMGCIGDFSIVWNMGDIFMGLMALVNLTVILKIGGIAIEIYDDYISQLHRGENPVFHADRIKRITTQLSCWK